MQARCISHHGQSKDSWRCSLEFPGPLGTQTVPGRGSIPGLLQKGGCTAVSESRFACTELACARPCHAYHHVLNWLNVHAPMTPFTVTPITLFTGFSATHRLLCNCYNILTCLKCLAQCCADFLCSARRCDCCFCPGPFPPDFLTNLLDSTASL